jgi:peptide/nickel transport system substrate-binding protein
MRFLKKAVVYGFLLLLTVTISFSQVYPQTLPVPREETLFMEDIATFRIFDSFNYFTPNGVEFAAGFWQIGTEYLWYCNLATGKIIPWLATKYSYTNNFKTCTISLRRGVTWSDGKPFTADDVVFTIKMIMSRPEFGGEGWKQEVADVRAKDPYTVVFDLKTPLPRFHYRFVNFICTATPIVPKHIWEGKDPLTFKNNPPVTTAPYKLKQVIPDLKMFIWERRDDYWGKKYGYFPGPKYVVYRTSPPPDADLQDLVNNVIDHAHNIDYLQMEAAMKRNPNVIIAPFLDPCPRGIWFNCATGPTADPRVRWAISYLVNREKMAKTLWKPETTPAKYPWAAYKYMEQFASKTVLEKYNLTFDPEKAAKLLDEAGYKLGPGGKRIGPDGKPLELEIITPVVTTGYEYLIAQDVAQEAAKIGVTITVKHLEGPVFAEYTSTGKFQITSHWLCGAGADPFELYRNLTSDRIMPLGQRAVRGNWVRLKDPALDKLVNKLANMAPDSKVALNTYYQALEEYLKVLPATPVIQTIYVMNWNQTYWKGWPTADNMYTVPFTWWGHFLFVTFNLKPAK